MPQSFRLSPLMSLILIMVSALPAVAITGTPSWKPRETVDSLASWNFTEQSDRMLAYDHHGNAGISFVDVADFSLDYARRVPGIGWVSTEVDPNDSLHPSLAYDRYERPAISYRTFSQGLRFAHFDGTSWQLETVDPVSANYTTLAFDILGHAAIAYTDQADFSLKYVRDTDGDFTFTDETPVTVSSVANTGFFPSLAFDSLNRPMIGHADPVSESVLFSLEEPGLGWITTTVEAYPGGVALPSLAMDPDNGFPALAYGGGTAGIRYAAWNGNTWDIVSVDPNAGNNSRLSVAFDPGDGNPVISYSVPDNNEMRFAWHNGSIWQNQTVDSGQTFLGNSVAFNDFGNGFASIGYLTDSNRLYFIEDPPAVVPEPGHAVFVCMAWVSMLVSRRKKTL